MDQVFDDILVSIAKANKERDALRKELAEQNTVKYQLLEVGAEAFHIVKHNILLCTMPMMQWWNNISFIFNIFIKQQQRQTLPPAPPQQQPNNAELSELLLELSKLREEMSALAKQQQAKTPPPKQPDYSFSTTKHKPLPFSADMLVSQRKTARPVVKVARPPPPTSSSNSIQDMLQRAIQEKFKNAKPPSRHQRSYSSSEEEEEEEEETPSFIQEKAQMEEECERATKRPPMPIRFSKRQGAGSKKSPLKTINNL